MIGKKFLAISQDGDLRDCNDREYYPECQRIDSAKYIKELYLGLTDIDDNKIYFNDIMEFPNDDRFIIRCETDYIWPYVEWIGEADCEDQVRDIYRIEGAKRIGNIHENKELLDVK